MQLNPSSRIYVAGHTGLVGSAICRRLAREGCSNVLLRSRQELDLTLQKAVDEFFTGHKPEFVFVAAARVGGIHANNTLPAEFIYENLMIQCNIIHAAWRHGAEKLLFLGSSCIYPRDAAQPIREEYLLTGPLEGTNESYAVAKIAGIRMAQSYRRQYGFNAISLMPTNLYGPADNFDPDMGHVIPALLRKFHEAKLLNAPRVVVWGSGAPRREFLHVDDLADAAVFAMKHYDEPEIINVGTGTDVTIFEVAQMICSVVDYRGQIVFDDTKPDGTPRKMLDVGRFASLGWKAKISLADGLADLYRWYVKFAA